MPTLNRVFTPWVLITVFSFLQNSQIAHSQQTAAIRGTVRDIETNQVIPYVNVVLRGTPFGTSSDEHGNYVIENVPSGRYILMASAVGFKKVEMDVSVEEGDNVARNIQLKSMPVEMGEVQVYGASLRKERITDAPAAMSVLDAREVKRLGTHGQLPKLLEAVPGVELVQSGLYDFNVNTRGFNSSLNRRLLILLDGRDLGTAFLGATEWNGLSVPLEELGRVELVRGPGSALYGANAYNGVMNITSVTPQSMPGSRLILAVGEKSMYRADIRHAGILDQWSYRINAGTISGKSWTTSRRNRNFEYSGFNNFLNNEVIDIDAGPVQTAYGSARTDYEFGKGNITTLEGGFSEVQREVIVTGIGRVQVNKAHRPWTRFHYSGGGFNVLLWSNWRLNVEPERSLSTGLEFTQDARQTHGEVQYHFTLLDNRLFCVAGVSHRLVTIDTKGTLMKEARDDNMSGIFGQVEYQAFSDLRAVVAARFDRSSLHESFFSPKAALVWNPSADHTLRASFNKAFQSPNYSELYLYIKHPTSAVAYLGNDNLAVEKITGYEIGYKAILTGNVYVTLDLFYNQLKDFITDLGPGLNPKYPQPIILPGDTVLRNIWSYTNAGKVNEYGSEISVNYYVTDNLSVETNFSYFNFEVVEKHPNDVLFPNAPRYKLNGTITYTHDEGHDVSLQVRHVPPYPWAAGVFRTVRTNQQGGEEVFNIPGYTIFNLAGSYRISHHLQVSVNISNLLDRRHYQIFGGSLLGRRAIASLTATF